jgi:parvulin-like peptidyl-prolyl isomerase
MTPLGKFSLRIGIYGAAFVYIICDLHFCHGPLSRRLSGTDPSGPAALAKAKAEGVVARVYGYSIHRSQLDRAVVDRLWTEGKTLADLSPANRKLVRLAALEDLIDHELLRMKVRVNTFDLVVSEQEINDRFQRFTERFATKAELDAAMKSQGILNEQALRDLLAARLQQEMYVESRIAPLIKVTDDEAREWYEANQQRLAIPERVAARHVFLPTLDRNPEEVKEILTTALAALTDKTKDFATLARELSDDPTTKEQGGSLGWLTRERLPADLAAPVFALPLNQPTLLRTKIGWHLMDVTGRKPAEPRTFDQAKPEILTALEAVKRRQATTAFRNELRKLEAKTVIIFREVVEEEGQ